MKTHRKNVEGAYCPPNTASSWLESRGGRARDGGAEGQVSDRPRLRGRKARVSAQVRCTRTRAREGASDQDRGGQRGGPRGPRGAGAAGQENGSRPPSAQTWGRNSQAAPWRAAGVTLAPPSGHSRGEAKNQAASLSPASLVSSEPGPPPARPLVAQGRPPGL